MNQWVWTVFRVLSVGLMAIWILAGAFGAQVFAQTDDECMFCHGEPDLIKESVSGEVTSQYVDHAIFAESVHAENGCASCHADIEELPHVADLAPVDCGGCHDEVEEYAESLHGVALKNGDRDAAICHDCHSKHDIRPVSDLLSPVHPRNLPQTCGRCHSDSALVKRHMVSVQKPSDAYIKSVHGKAVTLKGLETAAVCNDCHGTHNMLPSQDPNSRVFWLNIPQTCGQCHSGVVRTYSESIHGRALMAGIKDAPNCTDCHGEHDIESHLLPESATSPQQISKSTCPRCHDSERMMDRYGIATMRQASYMDSYHGMASAAGSDVVANCTSCHNVHDILPSDDPRSSTHLSNLPATCSRCHENAGENFAIGKVHISPTDPDQWVLGFVRTAYIVIIIVVVGGIVGHNTLMMARHAFSKFREELKGPSTHRRFNTGQTVGHLVMTISFIALAFSGFALRYPESWWAQLIFVGERGLAARGVVHRISAVVMVAVAVVNFFYLLFTRGGREELAALTAKWQDFKDFFQNLGYAMGMVKAPPRYDRYSYTEKFEYWGMWWGTALMIVTGFCMWFVDAFLRLLPKLALDVVALIHLYEAWLAVLTIIIWHLYYMVFDPETYPMNWSWITGHITEEDYKERHPIEYERMMQEKTAADLAESALSTESPQEDLPASPSQDTELASK